MPRGQADGDVIVDVLLNTKKAQKYWKDYINFMDLTSKQLENKLAASARKIETLTERRTSSKGLVKKLKQEQEEIGQRLDAYSFALKQAREKLKQWQEIEEYLNSGGSKDPTYFMKQYALQGELGTEEEITKEIEKQEALIAQQLAKHEALGEKIKVQQKRTKSINQELTREKNNFDGMNQRYIELNRNSEEQKRNARETAKSSKETANNTKAIHFNTKNIKRDTAKINTNLKSGIGHLGQGIKKIIRMGLALVGIRSIYTGISNALTTWMNSEDELAKQTKANLDNLKMNIANILQPALQWVINAFNNILGLIGAIVKQFTKLNIFANKTANSTDKMSKSASDTLASFDNIDVLKQDNDSDESIAPIDLTSYMEKYEKIAEDIKKAFEVIFDPFKKAWDNKGKNVIESARNALDGLGKVIEAVGGSFYRVWTNGTVQETIEHILQIFSNILKTIGNIGKAFAEAWKKDNNGDKIVQNLADAWNNVLSIIEKISRKIEEFTMSQEFQTAMDDMVYLWEKLSEWVEKVSATLEELWDEELEESFGTMLESTAKAVTIFKKLYDVIEPLLNLLYDNYFTQWLGTVAEAISDIVDTIGYAVDALEYLLEGDFEGSAKAIKRAFSSAAGAIQKVQAVKNPVSFAKYQMTRNEASTLDIVQEAISPTGTGGWMSKASNTLNKVQKEEEKINSQRVKNTQKTNKNILIDTTNSLLKMLGVDIDTYEDIENTEKEIYKDRQKNVDEYNEDLLSSTKQTTQELETETKTMAKKINDPFYTLKNTLDNLFYGLKQDIPRTAEEISTKTATPFQTLTDKIKTAFQLMRDSVNKDMTYTENNTISKAEETKKGTETPFSKMRNTVSTYVENLKSNVASNFSQIKNDTEIKAEQTQNKVQTPFSKMKDTLLWTFDVIAGNYRDMWSNISGNSNNPNINNAISAVETFANAIIQGLNGILEGYRGVRTYITNLPYVGNVAKVFLPKLAKGGIVAQATPAIIGEAGKEAVLPLENNTEWMDSLADKISAGLNVGINFTGSLSQLAQILKPEIDKENRRVGASLIQGGGY